MGRHGRPEAGCERKKPIAPSVSPTDNLKGQHLRQRGDVSQALLMIREEARGAKERR